MAAPKSSIAGVDRDPASLPAMLRMLAAFVLVRAVLALVVYVINGSAGFIHDDTASYVDSAQSLLRGSFFRNGAPELFRTPGYPVALMPVVLFPHFQILAVLENIGLSTLCAWLIYRIVWDLFPNSKAAVTSVFLYCFEPISLAYSAKIVTEPLFCAQLLAFVFLTTRFFRKPGYGLLLATALIAASTAYTRPIAIFLGLWQVPTFLLLPRMLPVRQRLARAIVFPVIFSVALLPWVIRNQTVAGYSGFSGAGDYNLYFYNAAAVRARLEHKTFAEFADATQYLQTHPEQQTWTEAQRFMFQRKTGERILLDHPWTYLLIHLKGCAVVLLDPGIMEVKVFHLLPERTGLFDNSQNRGLAHAALSILRAYPAAGVTLMALEAWLWIYYLLAAKGLRRLPLEVAFFLISLIVYFVVIAGGPAAMARYRMPIMPLLCVPASLSVMGWRHRTTNIRTDFQAAD